MEPDQNPFATPSRPSGSYDADDVAVDAIGIAITADERRSPATPNGHHTHSSVSTVASEHSAHRVNPFNQPTYHQPDLSAAPGRVVESQQRRPAAHDVDRTGVFGRQHDTGRASLDGEYTPRASSIGAVDPFATPDRASRRALRTPSRSSSRAESRSRAGSNADDSSSSIDSTRSATQTRTLRPTHRNRRPPVSMRRVLNIPPPNSEWPTSPHSTRHPVSAQTLVPGITIDTPTPTHDEHGQLVGPPGSSHSSFTSVAWSDHGASRPHSRQGSLQLSRSSIKSEASSGKSRKVAFADSTTPGDNLDPRNLSRAPHDTAPEAPDLLYPSRAVLGTARNPFDDSFGHDQNQSRDAGHRVSDGRRPSSERAGFLERIGRRVSGPVSPLDATVRNNSTSYYSETSTRRPSLASSQRNGSAASIGNYRPRQHSRSLWDRRPSFRDPFRRRSHDDVDAHLTGGRRKSEPDVRRPSSARRLSSYVVPEHPIPPKYRSRSVSSLRFYVSPMEKVNKKIPIFGDRVEEEKENVEEFLAAVEVLQARAVRKPWHSKAFRVAYFFAILCIVYFVFVGQPLWDGVGLVLYRFIHTSGIPKAGSALFMGWAALQAFVPMLGATFEQEVDDVEKRDASEVALVIPAYKAAKILPETIRHALKIFKPEQIFIMANGNSPTPVDDTAEVCAEFGVNVAWVPIGSKITAEFVGVAITSKYKYIMLIDDDVHLPANLPMVTDRIQGRTKCVGYTLKSTGADGCRGTLIQQCQDVEYKLSGLTRVFCSKYGSATFPHGAIILWDRETLQALFNVHPGYAISEDWFFGHAARASGHRIAFCSQVFVETETPPSLFFTSGPARGGFGEMTVFKQRFYRWNFFWGTRMWEDSVYILFSWRLGWYEIATKFAVLVELYDSVMAFLRPWVIALALMANYRLLFILIAGLIGMYTVAFALFNGWHLRRKNEMVAWKVLPVYMGMKFALMWVNVASVYYGLYGYAKYFSVKHPKVIESRSVLEAAYKARLGPNLVPLDAKLGDATAAAEAAAAKTAEKVEAAEPLEEVLP